MKHTRVVTDDNNVQKVAGQQIRSKIDSFQNAFLFLNQTLWCYHSLESYRRDDFNEDHTIGFGWEMRKLSWKPFCSLFLNCSPGLSKQRTPRDVLLLQRFSPRLSLRFTRRSSETNDPHFCCNYDIASVKHIRRSFYNVLYVPSSGNTQRNKTNRPSTLSLP